MPKLIDQNLLKTFVPTNSLNSGYFKELAKKTFLENVTSGATIFKLGGTDKKTIYLIAGKLTITSKEGKSIEVISGTTLARHPIANFQPRRHTAIAKTDCIITRVDSGILDALMTRDQVLEGKPKIAPKNSHAPQVTDDNNSNDDDDWMTQILQSPVFMRVPPGNIQAMFMRLERITKKANDFVIKQGEEGDYYYIIERGQCKVTRSSKTSTEITLAKLKKGDSFGEEALISDQKRNANVVMITDGGLLRLSKKDFQELLKSPMLQWVTRKEADDLVKAGATWLDVRLKSEYENDHIEGSVNIPLMLLRIKCATLDANKQYVICCDTGSRSSAAAFLLAEQGIDSVCLKGGLSSS